MHIFENEYLRNKRVIDDIINYGCHQLNKKFHARKCKFITITQKEYYDFLWRNCTVDNDDLDKAFALVINNTVAMVAGVKKHKNYYMITNVCSLCDHVVVGGVSKLVKNIKKFFNISSLYIANDKSKFTGNVFKRLGKLLYTTAPKVLTNHKQVSNNYSLFDSGWDVYEL